MKTHCSRLLSVSTVLLVGVLAGCTSTSERRPTVAYPVTYDVPFGNTQVSATTGNQNLNVSATQQVEADVGDPLYFQIVSPVPVSVAVYQRETGDDDRELLREFQGTSLTGSVVPGEPNLEFVFSAPRSNSSGTLRFTLSDKPLAPAVSTVEVVE